MNESPVTSVQDKRMETRQREGLRQNWINVWTSEPACKRYRKSQFFLITAGCYFYK